MPPDQYATVGVVDLLTQSIPKLYYSKSDQKYDSHDWDTIEHCSIVYDTSFQFAPSKIREALSNPMMISYKHSDCHYYFNTPDAQALRKFDEAIYNLSAKIVMLLKKL